MTARFLVSISALALGVVSACGGATDTGLFGGGGTDAGATTDGSAGHDTGVGQDATTGPDGNMQVDAAPPRDSAPPVDSAPPDLVRCEGTGGCVVGMDACCRKMGTTMSSCEPIGTCNGSGELEIPCDKQRDCEILGPQGSVCCVTGANPGASDVSCRLPSECTSNQGRTQLCDPQMTNPCPSGLHCLPSMSTIPGYDICR